MRWEGHMYGWVSWMLSRTTMFGNNETVEWAELGVCIG